MQCIALLPFTGTVTSMSHTARILQNEHMGGGWGSGESVGTVGTKSGE